MFEIGGTLREARSRAGLEFSDVESATMIPARFLEALEKEQFDRLPVGLYRRSFLREYADFLGLDGEIYVHEYELRVAPPDHDQPPEPVSRGSATAGRLLEVYSPGRAAAVCLAALAALAVWQLGSSPSHTDVVRQPPRSVHREASPRLHRAVTTPTSVPTRPPASATPSPLTLSAVHGNSWLLVRIASSSGRIVFDHTLRQGDTARFGLRQRLFISLGAPWNLDARIGRRSVTATLPNTTASMIATRKGLTETTDSTPAATATNSSGGTPAQTTSIKRTPAVELNTRGYRLMLSGDYIAALPLLRAAVDGLDDPANPVTFYANFNLGQALVKLGRCTIAIPYLDRAAKLQPTNRRATDALTNARKC
jgi:Helix-turn-helix domain